ncbi:MAG: hypothetical protein ACRC62_11285 [Microcoleus sp.]
MNVWHGRRKKEEGRRQKAEGRGKREEAPDLTTICTNLDLVSFCTVAQSPIPNPQSPIQNPKSKI